MSRADKLRIKDYLGHILEAIERINRYVGMSGVWTKTIFYMTKKPRTR